MNLMAGILCFLMGIVYLLCALFEGDLPYVIGFPFWIFAALCWIKTYMNEKRK